MKRLSFTIALNAERHLLFNNYANYLANDVLDYWVIAEGAVKNNSSKHCPGNNDKYHVNGRSIDKTNLILDTLERKYPDKVKIIRKEGLWDSKDEMVNTAIDTIKLKYNSGWLYGIDVDEVWKLEDMIENENFLLLNNAKTGESRFYQYVGKDIIAVGPNWGDNTCIRLWNWNGERFLSHAPSILENEGKKIIMPKKFHHYSYVYEDEVLFKSIYYGYGDDFFNRWKKLQTQTEFPRLLSELFTGQQAENGIIKKI